MNTCDLKIEEIKADHRFWQTFETEKAKLLGFSGRHSAVFEHQQYGVIQLTSAHLKLLELL